MVHNLSASAGSATANFASSFVQDDNIRRMEQVGLAPGAPARIAKKLNLSIHAVRSQIEGRRPLQLRVHRAVVSELEPSVRLAVARAEHAGQALAVTILDAGENPTLSDPVRLMADVARVSRAAANLTVEATKAVYDNELISEERIALFRLAEDVSALAASLAEHVAPCLAYVPNAQAELFS